MEVYCILINSVHMHTCMLTSTHLGQVKEKQEESLTEVHHHFFFFFCSVKYLRLVPPHKPYTPSGLASILTFNKNKWLKCTIIKNTKRQKIQEGLAWLFKKKETIEIKLDKPCNIKAINGHLKFLA